jgi:hypothetical protein
VNSAENRTNFCKGLDGKPLLSALYGMYAVTLNGLKAVLKVSPQAGQSDAANKTSVESKTQDDDFQEVKRRKRLISNKPRRQPRSRLNQSQRRSCPAVSEKSTNSQTSSHLSGLLKWCRGRITGAGGSQKTRQVAINSDDFYHKSHSTLKPLKIPRQWRARVPKPTKWNL